MAQLGDSLNSEHEREFAELKRSRLAVVRYLVAGAAVFGLVLFLMSAFSGEPPPRGGLDVARRELVTSGVVEVREIVSTHAELVDWLRRNATAGEAALFERVALGVFASAATFSRGSRDGSHLGVFARAYLGLHSGVLRATFILISGWRLWVVAVLATGCWVYIRFRVHAGLDLLGVTGNGRLFYSGARVDLSKVNERGAPDVLIPGLACPARESAAVVRASPLGRCLVEFGAANETTLGLAGIVLKRASDPAFVADYEDEDRLRRAFTGATLGEQAERTVRVALEVHRQMGAGDDGGVAQAEGGGVTGELVGLSGEAYAAEVRGALWRVLTPLQRQALAGLAPADIAVLVLGLEAGKVLVHTREGGRWTRRSRFPQLCARAMVHSLPSFGTEYSYLARQTIRRAFVYGSRKSDFAAVRFPLDLSAESRAARQWVEILMACPHELAASAAEVELLALLTEGQQRWAEIFFDAARTTHGGGLEGSFATHGNLFLMPLARVVNVLRESVPGTTQRRIEALMLAVSARQQTAGRDGAAEGGVERVIPSYERVTPPLSAAEVTTLANFHGVSADDVRTWGALRLVLNSFGWLARRVGDHTVPESSLVAAIVTVGVGAPGANALGLVGRRGLVPLRGSHLEAVWGRAWRDRFVLVDRVRTAETNEEFDQRMAGIEEREDDITQSAAVDRGTA